jgi:hypothetical protein
LTRYATDSFTTSRKLGLVSGTDDAGTQEARINKNFSAGCGKVMKISICCSKQKIRTCRVYFYCQPQPLTLASV